MLCYKNKAVALSYRYIHDSVRDQNLDHDRQIFSPVFKAFDKRNATLACFCMLVRMCYLPSYSQSTLVSVRLWVFGFAFWPGESSAMPREIEVAAQPLSLFVNVHRWPRSVCRPSNDHISLLCGLFFPFKALALSTVTAERLSVLPLYTCALQAT